MDEPPAPLPTPPPEPARAALGAPPDGTLPTLVQAARRGAGLSRAALAARVGVPEHTIALWEDPAYQGVDLSILARVARATGRRLDVRLTAPRRAPRPLRPAWEDLITP